MGTRELGVAVGSGFFALLWAAVVLQACLAAYFLVMGLGWGGILYSANVFQGVALLVVAVVLAARRHMVVLVVPVLSLVLSLGLQGVDGLLTARACSPAAKAAVAELGLNYLDSDDPDTYVLAFPSGCSALFNPRGDPVAVVVERYRRAGREAGWDILTAPDSRRLELSDTRWTVEVEPYEKEEGLVQLVVHTRHR